jgi:hypothetical protein
MRSLGTCEAGFVVPPRRSLALSPAEPFTGPGKPRGGGSSVIAPSTDEQGWHRVRLALGRSRATHLPSRSSLNGGLWRKRRGHSRQIPSRFGTRSGLRRPRGRRWGGSRASSRRKGQATWGHGSSRGEDHERPPARNGRWGDRQRAAEPTRGANRPGSARDWGQRSRHWRPGERDAHAGTCGRDCALAQDLFEHTGEGPLWLDRAGRQPRSSRRGAPRKAELIQIQ